MLSAVIYPAHRQPAVPLARQLAHERCVRPGPLVLGTTPLKPPTPMVDRDRQFCYSRATSARGPGHFCLTLHVAMQLGLYLPGLSSPVRHTVSEDSEQLGALSTAPSGAGRSRSSRARAPRAR